MGNNCCSEVGGHTQELEYKSNDDLQRQSQKPYAQSLETHNEVKQIDGAVSFGKESIFKDDPNLLLAYTSGEQKKLVRLHNDFRGDQTRKNIEEGNQVMQESLDQYKSGNLMNVQEMRVDQ